MGNEAGKLGSAKNWDSQTKERVLKEAEKRGIPESDIPSWIKHSTIGKNKVSLADFLTISTVGKGSFGKVLQVKKKVRHCLLFFLLSSM